MATQPIPVDLDEADAFGWFAELVEAQVEDVAGWLQLVAAIQRDWTELVRQLPPHALVGVPARSSAEAIEALLDQLRGQLAVAATGTWQ